MLRRIIAMAPVLVIVVALLAVPAYGDFRQGDEQAVQAYNSHNLFYDAEISLFADH